MYLLKDIGKREGKYYAINVPLKDRIDDANFTRLFKTVSNVTLFMQVTGGGGYTKENVARCWAVETGVLLDAELPNGGIKENLNSKSYLSTIKVQVLESLRCIQHAPRVQMQGSRRELNDPENALIGAFAGAITGAITTPLDVMKTRLMVQVQSNTRVGSSHRQARPKGVWLFGVVNLSPEGEGDVAGSGSKEGISLSLISQSQESSTLPPYCSSTAVSSVESSMASSSSTSKEQHSTLDHDI
ncbi:histone deacetylase 9 isoform X4 [Canna indica]|uniref:Histone deacetylase 9 isoform X4 n=1 Tax=Canna indica TaxID=4628 RepID=A0AAQ3PZC1_9LILI|nr:histone deacetylase 9 isoform X4 [Canna indica]